MIRKRKRPEWKLVKIRQIEFLASISKYFHQSHRVRQSKIYECKYWPLNKIHHVSRCFFDLKMFLETCYSTITLNIMTMNGKKYPNSIQRTLDMCEFMLDPSSDPMMNMVHEKLSKSGELLPKCPIKQVRSTASHLHESRICTYFFDFMLFREYMVHRTKFYFKDRKISHVHTWNEI